MNNKSRTILIHGGLFLVTLITTTMAGAEWTYGKSIFFSEHYTWHDFISGFAYSIPFLMILTVHEFGHYFTAVYHRVRVSLPYYIPLPPLLLLGTMGAVIRLKERPPSRQLHFDIGIAGPLAGFFLALGILWYGFSHLPPADYILQFHPEYAKYGTAYAEYVYQPSFMKGVPDIIFGKNLLFLFFENYVADPARIPNAHEIMHYPLLFSGFLALVFTSLNLLPIGQLDGGHILYGLVGYRMHRMVASVVYVLLLLFSGLGLVSPRDPVLDLTWEIPMYIAFLYIALSGLRLSKRNTLMYAVGMFTAQYVIVLLFPAIKSHVGWLIFAFIVGRIVGVDHPPSPIEAPLSTARKILGWIAFLIFVICITPNPLELVAPTTAAP